MLEKLIIKYYEFIYNGENLNIINDNKFFISLSPIFQKTMSCLFFNFDFVVPYHLKCFYSKEKIIVSWETIIKIPWAPFAGQIHLIRIVLNTSVSLQTLLFLLHFCNLYLYHFKLVFSMFNLFKI